jgi:hypothetical protein
MTDTTEERKKRSEAEREARLAKALKANLRRRKAAANDSEKDR